jgi:hypothetical protein
VRGLFSVISIVCITSSALAMASCSAWLFEHLFSSLNFSCAVSSSPTNITTPDPTPCSFLLPSVYTWNIWSLYSLTSTILTSAGCGQFLSSSSRSVNYVWLPFLFVELYFFTASSVLIIMGGIPVKMHSASLDVVRYALAIFVFISICTLIYFCLLYPYLIASMQTGALYRKRFKIAALYIVFSASRFSPADLDKL